MRLTKHLASTVHGLADYACGIMPLQPTVFDSNINASIYKLEFLCKCLTRPQHKLRLLDDLKAHTNQQATDEIDKADIPAHPKSIPSMLHQRCIHLRLEDVQ